MGNVRILAPGRWSAREIGLLAGVLLVGAGLRAWALTAGGLESSDAWVYWNLARDFRHLGLAAGFDSTVPCMYSWLMAVFAPTDEALLATGRVISAVAGVALLGGVYWIGRSLAGMAGGLAAALVAATQLHLVFYSTQVQTESLYACCVVYAVLATWKAGETGSTPWSLGAGLLWGLAFLVRTEAVFYPVVAVPLLAWWRGRRPALLAALAFAAVLVPFALAVHAQVGHWTLRSGAGYGLLDKQEGLHGLTEDGEAVVWDRVKLQGVDAGVSEWAAGLGRKFLAVPAVLHNWYRQDLSWHLGIIPAALIPFALLFLPGGRRLHALFALLIASTCLGYAFAHYRHRYLTCLDPLWAVWAGAGWVALLAVLEARKVPRARWIGALVALAVLVPSIKDATYPLYRPADEQPLEFRTAGQWIAGHDAGSPVILGVERWSSLYAGGSFRFWPEEPPERVLAHAREIGARWLVEGERTPWVPAVPMAEGAPGVRLATRLQEAGGAVKVWEVMAP